MYPIRPVSAPSFLYDLRCEHLSSPLGLDEGSPRLSWKIADSTIGAVQTAYEIRVSSSEDRAKAGQGDIWSSGKIPSDQSHLVVYRGKPLEAHTRYFWCVRIWDKNSAVSRWSPASWWETGFLGARWPAKWIGVPSKNHLKSSSARYLRRSFTLPSTPMRARLYMSSLGIFEPYVNGVVVGRDMLAPGWTDYDRRVEYVTYDVTGQLAKGVNAVGAILCDGWYAGFLNWEAKRGHYGKDPALLAAIRIVLEDGRVKWIGTSPSWKSVPGPIVEADLYNGESYDARKAVPGWAAKDFPDGRHPNVTSMRVRPIKVSGKATPPIRAISEVSPKSIKEPAAGSYVFDLGQNIVGTVRLKVTARKGTRVRLRYAEMLEKDGTVYTANLRTAKATDHYVCNGGEMEIYEPRFTFHGFRYVEITGLSTRPSASAITGIVLHSDLRSTGAFSCSNRLVNQLQSNIRWGQMGNFLDVPTDCPQRDERLGWTGDAQVFVTTSSFNFDVATFFRKWLQDLRDGQHPNGAYPDVAPDTLALAARKDPAAWLKNANKGNAAWADAGVICPWAIYQRYGDIRVLEENYASMGKWIAFQKRTSRRLVRPDTLYGDWLAVDAVTPQRAPTPCDLIGTAYFARTTWLMAEIAEVLGKNSDALRYRKLHAGIVGAFNREFVTSGGRVAGDTQTGYLLALSFDLLPVPARQRAVDRLVWLIEKHHNRLATGFVGTPLLCPVLGRFGRSDIAYRLLLQRGYPSWLYPVLNGATTMWERWNSWTRSGGFGDVAMNSFNHYAYGAIGEWLYSSVAGIDVALGAKAGERLMLCPKPGGGLSRASARLETPYGEVKSAWRMTRGIWVWDVSIPPNLSAHVELPALGPRNVRANGRTLEKAEGVVGCKETRTAVIVHVCAGKYRFIVSKPTCWPAGKSGGAND